MDARVLLISSTSVCGYVVSRDETLLNVPLQLPARLCELLASYKRPVPAEITVQRILDLLEPNHSGVSNTRCTIARCGIEGCAICGGVYQGMPFPWTSDRQFPSPRPDPSNETHYVPWYNLVSLASIDEIETYDFRPSSLIEEHIAGSSFKIGNLRMALNSTSSLLKGLKLECRVSSPAEAHLVELEAKKQVERCLKKMSLPSSIIQCGDCKSKICCLDSGYCCNCKHNVCQACWQEKHKSIEHVGESPRISSNDIDWKVALDTGLVNGNRLTKRMLVERLKDVGLWLSSYGRLKKAALLEHVWQTIFI